MQIYPQLLTCSLTAGQQSTKNGKENTENINNEETNSIAQRMIKELVAAVRASRSTRVEGDLIYEVVPSPYVLPKSMSEEKIKTKWEKFAEEKGIKRKKRSRNVFSEKFDKWVPRFGSRSEQNLTLQGGVVEVEQSMSKMLNEKRKRIAKNKKNAEDNKKRAKEATKISSKK